MQAKSEMTHVREIGSRIKRRAFCYLVLGVQKILHSWYTDKEQNSQSKIRKHFVISRPIQWLWGSLDVTAATLNFALLLSSSILHFQFPVSTLTTNLHQHKSCTRWYFKHTQMQVWSLSLCSEIMNRCKRKKNVDWVFKLAQFNATVALKNNSNQSVLIKTELASDAHRQSHAAFDISTQH